MSIDFSASGEGSIGGSASGSVSGGGSFGGSASGSVSGGGSFEGSASGSVSGGGSFGGSASGSVSGGGSFGGSASGSGTLGGSFGGGANATLSGSSKLTAKGGLSAGAMSKPEGLHATRFYVAIDKVVGAVFTEISGLSMQTDIQETITEGGNPWKHKLPGYSSFGNLTLKRGLVVSQAFWQWYVKTVNGQVEYRNVSIILYSSDYPDTPRRRWEIYDAYPVKWSISSLNAKSNELVTESLEFAFSHFVPSL